MFWRYKFGGDAHFVRSRKRYFLGLGESENSREAMIETREMEFGQNMAETPTETVVAYAGCRSKLDKVHAQAREEPSFTSTWPQARNSSIF